MGNVAKFAMSQIVSDTKDFFSLLYARGMETSRYFSLLVPACVTGLIIGNFAVPTFTLVIVASVIVTVVSRTHLGDSPAFLVPAYTLPSTRARQEAYQMTKPAHALQHKPTTRVWADPSNTVVLFGFGIVGSLESMPEFRVPTLSQAQAFTPESLAEWLCRAVLTEHPEATLLFFLGATALSFAPTQKQTDCPTASPSALSD